MKPKTLFLLALAIIVILGLGIIFLWPNQKPNSPLDLPQVTKKEIQPSETLTEYIDPSGFSFNYPDNLSIEKNEVVDTNTYADLQLFSKDLSGSLNLRITDTKLKTLDDWLKDASVSGTSTEKKLGNLKALEVKTSDRLMLAALDQGVLFSIEIPLIEQDFWMKVYDKVLSGFTFTTPDTTSTAGTSDSSSGDIVFEGEEVVE